MVDFTMEKKVGGIVREKRGLVMEVLNGKDSGFVAFDGESVELSLGCDGLEDGVEAQTPKGSIFDPFAPAGEELALAPMKKKVEKETRCPLRRQLDFESRIENVGDEDEEECLLEGLHAELFDFIVAMQLGEMAERDPVPVSECLTPSSVRLTGVAEVCPDAPKRARLVARRSTERLCRKLDFESDSS